MSGLMGRGIAHKRRMAPLPVVACPTKDGTGAKCKGTLYQLKEGEHLSRRTRPGWSTEIRQCQCEVCGHRQEIPILVRDAR